MWGYDGAKVGGLDFTQYLPRLAKVPLSPPPWCRQRRGKKKILPGRNSSFSLNFMNNYTLDPLMGWRSTPMANLPSLLIGVCGHDGNRVDLVAAWLASALLGISPTADRARPRDGTPDHRKKIQTEAPRQCRDSRSQRTRSKRSAGFFRFQRIPRQTLGNGPNLWICIGIHCCVYCC